MYESSLKSQLESVLDRVDREITRDEEASTARVGGLTKLGNELEMLLKLAAGQAVQQEGSSLSQEIPRRFGKEARGSLGRYAEILRRMRSADMGDPVLRQIVVDLHQNKASSVLGRLVELRNKNNHPAGFDGLDFVADLPETKRLLRELRQWARVVLRTS